MTHRGRLAIAAAGRSAPVPAPRRGVATSLATITVLSAAAVLAVGWPALRPVALAAVAAPLAIAAGLAVVSSPRIALALLVVVVVSHAADGLGVPRLFVVTFALATLAALRGLRRGTLRLCWSPVYPAALLLVAVQAVAAIAATDARTALPAVLNTAGALLVLPVVVVLASAAGGVRILIRAATISIVVLAGLGLAQEFVLHNGGHLAGFTKLAPADPGSVTARHAGPLEDPNFWGRDLVLFVPLAVALAHAARSGGCRLAWLAAAGALVGAIYLTQSRGAFVAVGCAVLAWLALAGGRPRRLLWLAPLAVAAALVLPGVGSRLATIGSVTQAATGAGDPSLVGRVDALRAGLAIVADHPVLGVGPGNWDQAAAAYQRRDGASSTRVLAPHNLYLEVASETGAAGLLAWFGFFAAALFVAARCLLLRRVRPGDVEGGTLPAGLLAGLLGWAVASVFLHLGDFLTLLLVVALAVRLDVEARRRAGEPLPVSGPVDQPPERARQALRAGLPLAAAGVVFAAAIAPLPAAGRHWARWVAHTEAVVEPGDASRTDAYGFSVGGRRAVVSTYGAITSELSRPAEAANVTVTASPQGNLVSVTAEAPTRPAAERSAGVALQRGIDYVRAHAPLYTLRPVRPVPVADLTTRPPRALVLGSVLGAALLAVLTHRLVRRRLTRTRTGNRPELRTVASSS